jgi:hypothetical protein
MAREMRDGKVHAGPGNDPSAPPAGLPYRPAGVNSQHLVPNRREGQGVDRTARARNFHLDYDRSGAHAWLRYGDLIRTPRTARLQVVRLSVPRPEPQAGPRAVTWVNRPALQLPGYRLTGKPDQEVYAEARARAAARAKRR